MARENVNLEAPNINVRVFYLMLLCDKFRVNKILDYWDNNDAFDERSADYFVSRCYIHDLVELNIFKCKPTVHREEILEFIELCKKYRSIDND